MRGSTDTKHAVGPAPGKPGIYRVKRARRRDWQLLLLCAVPILYFILFHYVPMYGVQIAFKDFRAVDGIWGSQWCGFKHFDRFFSSSQFWPLIKNTLGLSFTAGVPDSGSSGNYAESGEAPEVPEICAVDRVLPALYIDRRPDRYAVHILITEKWSDQPGDSAVRR